MELQLHAATAEKKPTALALKPFDHIENLISHALPFAERTIVSKGDIVHYVREDVRQCFLLLHGSVALHRRGDGIVLNSESAPFVLGVSRQLTGEQLYVRALETSELASISLECFNQIVANADLWKHFARQLVYTTSRI